MKVSLEQPAFGAADLTNCERELIHLTGSIQPHGALIVLGEPEMEILQVSANTDTFVGIPADVLLGRHASILGGDLVERIAALAREGSLAIPYPLKCTVAPRGEPMRCTALVHRVLNGGLVVEVERLEAGTPHRPTPSLAQRLTSVVTRFSSAHSIGSLCNSVVDELRNLTGYDRVMVYKFDADGHGEIFAEACDANLEAFLGRHYPASDIPQRARELYLRNRARVLVDVHYEPVPIVPRNSPRTGAELDMSMCTLRSMSPLHLQYLKNMGVTATLVASLVHDGRLWGLIACHHYSPKAVSGEIRAAAELLSGVISTRISALEHFAEAQAEVLVRRLEQRVIEATATGGDWRAALFDTPRNLLQPLDATGAALLYDGELLTTGEVPSTPEIRALFSWIAGRGEDTLFQCSSVAKTIPALASLTPTASGVLAVELSRRNGEYLAWFRKEQLHNVTWGGDPTKPVMATNDPLELSPRRSFAEWHQIVRETSTAWSATEVALARAIGTSLSDIVLQIRAVRVLIAEHQLLQVRRSVEHANEPVIVADGMGRVLLASASLSQLIRGPHRSWETLQDLAPHFVNPERFAEILRGLKNDRRSWRGELHLAGADRSSTPVAVRADVVPGPGGAVLGYIVIITDITARKEAEAARQNLQHAILRAQQPTELMAKGMLSSSREVAELVAAIWANAGVAVSEIADAVTVAAVAPLLREVEDTARHSTHLTGVIESYTSPERSGT